MTSDSNNTIGIFDSGVGGLTVWREIVRQIPHASTLYFADQAHIPYGPRGLEEIRRYAVGITRFLLAQGATVIVVACNTASGAALNHLRDTFPNVPFVGMEPAVKPAAEHTRSGIVGVIATPATFQGQLFHELAARFASQVTLKTQTCPGLVEQVEAGALDNAETETLLHTCLDSMVASGIDQLVLGCTHYPFLSSAIRRVIGDGITLVDPAPAVARQTGRMLARHRRQNAHMPTPQASGENVSHALPPSHHRFYTSGIPDRLAEMAQKLVAYTGPVLPVTWENGFIVL